MTKFVGLRAKTYSYLIYNSNKDEEVKNRKEFIRNSKSILKTQQRFESERHNVITEEVNEIALISNDDKKMQSIDSIETYAYGMSKDLNK